MRPSRPFSAEQHLHLLALEHAGHREDVADVVVDDQHLAPGEHGVAVVQGGDGVSPGPSGRLSSGFGAGTAAVSSSSRSRRLDVLHAAGCHRGAATSRSSRFATAFGRVENIGTGDPPARPIRVGPSPCPALMSPPHQGPPRRMTASHRAATPVTSATSPAATMSTPSLAIGSSICVPFRRVGRDHEHALLGTRARRIAVDLGRTPHRARPCWRPASDATPRGARCAARARSPRRPR